ncbi:MAG: DUF1538 domain-containing protein [Acidobacteriota bacterium]|nr:DUF1538 domain-containing protein [Acidobacteriota bacterium]MDH3785508.1 DUF1538 domain-containing protein [Acidobacteriota bacterium]
MDALTNALLATVRDVAALSALLLGFQLFVLRQPIPHLKRVLVGLLLAVLGLAFFLVGLELALFPLGQSMATQLSSPDFVFGGGAAPDSPRWWMYGWIYLFAAIIGFSTTLAEPALIAVAFKAKQASRGTVRPWGLRLVVAFGVGVGISLGTFRIVTGTSLVLFIAAGYLIVLVQTFFAPKSIIPLAYDSGGVTTSTVTVPLVTALGLGLSATIPGRNPALDGFGLIAFASLFPMITVMGYAQFAALWAKLRSR